MRRATILLVLIVLIAGAAVLLISQPRLLDLTGLTGDTGQLRTMTRSFLEDLQFKDFDKAATYHAPVDQASVDIPFLIQRLFAVKPEQLDIMEYEILFVKVDSSGLRARVKARVKAKVLLNQKIQDRELMLYFHRQTLESPWYMKLESSLRNPEADKNKKH